MKKPILSRECSQSLGEIDVDRNKTVPSLGEDGQNRSSGVMSQCLGIGLGSLACNHINPLSGLNSMKKKSHKLIVNNNSLIPSVFK